MAKNTTPHNAASEVYISFINDAKQGKFTENKPIISEILYQRIETQPEVVQETAAMDQPAEALLFGLSS